MVSHICEQCGATVPDDEQFCPSCGAFQDPLRQSTPVVAPGRPRRPGNVISVSSDGPYEEFRLDEPAPPPPPAPRRSAAATVECPSCHAPNPSTNLHCQNCGARLRQDPLPTAPRPAVQATAGVRAALAISGLLLVVILVALAVNLFGDDASAGSTTLPAASTSSSLQVAENGPIEILSVDCSHTGLGGFICENLTNGTGTEFQVNWEELEAAEETLTITLNFSQPMIVERIDWTNISDETRFRQNHRANGLTLEADNQLVPLSTNLEDRPGAQQIPWTALNANYVRITIHSTHRSQVVEDQSFPELAIDEITVIGRPYTPPS
ncbi:MAG TPA: zinc-ribbon domain-containing protein [Acidimicrobiia bacterium]